MIKKMAPTNFIRNNLVEYWYTKKGSTKKIHHVTQAACFFAWSLLTPQQVIAQELISVTFKLNIPKDIFTDKEINLYCKDMKSIFYYLKPVFGEICVDDKYRSKTVTVKLDKSKQATFAFFTALRYVQEFPHLAYRYLLFRKFVKEKVQALYLSHLFMLNDRYNLIFEPCNYNHQLMGSYGFRNNYSLNFTPESWRLTSKYNGIFEVTHPTIPVEIQTYGIIEEKELITMAKNLAKKYDVYKQPVKRKAQNEAIAAN